MLARVLVSGWSGLARRCALSVAAGLALCGCAGLPADWPLYTALDFWEASVEASAAERDVLWNDAQKQGLDWRIALLQSLPDYHRHNPRAARAGLERAIETNPYDEVATIARIRLAEMENTRACHARSAELEERMSKIIAIERSLGKDADD